VSATTTSGAPRIVAVAVAVLLFFVLWAAVAARPWAAAGPADPRLARLERREARVRSELAVAQARLQARWEAYRRALDARAAAVPAPAPPPPAVAVTQLPPVTATRSS
jgi:hypothetical protein